MAATAEMKISFDKEGLEQFEVLVVAFVAAVTRLEALLTQEQIDDPYELLFDEGMGRC